MALDPNIILQARPMDLGQVGDSFLKGAQAGSNIASQKSQMETQKLQNKLTEQQIADTRFKNLDAREQSRLRSVILGSAELKNYLDSNNTEGAKSFLLNRRANLQKRIAEGDNVDTTETDEALQMLDKNPKQLMQNVGQLTKFGQQLGVLSDPRANEADLNLKNAQANYYNRRDSFGIGPGGSRAPVGYRYNPEGNLEAIQGGPYDKNNKPLPANIVRLQDEGLQVVGTMESINKDLSSFAKQIDNKELDLGLINNVESKFRNYTGQSTEQSRNFASFSNTLEKLRNDSLILNKGVQTEGDAQRAWNQLIANLNDDNLVKQRLEEIQKINARGAELKRIQINQIRSEYGKNPLNYDNYNQILSAISQQNSTGQIKFLGFE